MSAAHGTVNRIVNDRAALDHPEHFQVVETCLRHNDISAVSDGIHLSLFHMAAFGVGAPRPNLDKKGVFRETLDFLVGIGIPKNSLFLTVFAGGNIAGRQYRRDEESLTILAELGIRDGQIGLVRGRKNFVYLRRDDEPAGPRCEIHIQSSETMAPSYIEIGAAIFEEYVFSSTGLRQVRNAVGGAAFGLERLLLASRKVRSVFDLPLFERLRHTLDRLVGGKRVGAGTDLYTILDASRAFVALSTVPIEDMGRHQRRIYRKVGRVLTELAQSYGIGSMQALTPLLTDAQRTILEPVGQSIDIPKVVERLEQLAR